MLRVILQVGLQGSDQIHDLELPAECAAGDLAYRISRAMGWNPSNVPFEIVSDAKRPLGRDESLADAGLWDGSVIVLRPDPNAPQPDLKKSARTEEHPSPQQPFLQSPTGARYLIGPVETRLGRGAREDTQGVRWLDLSNEAGALGVSHHHAVIVARDGHWVITALPQSRNRTSLSGRTLVRGAAYPLMEGDSLQLGAVELTFVVPTGGDERD